MKTMLPHSSFVCKRPVYDDAFPSPYGKMVICYTSPGGPFNYFVTSLGLCYREQFSLQCFSSVSKAFQMQWIRVNETAISLSGVPHLDAQILSLAPRNGSHPFHVTCGAKHAAYEIPCNLSQGGKKRAAPD